MHLPKSIVAFLIIITMHFSSAFALQPEVMYRYIQYSQNNKAFFKTIPFSRHFASIGKTIIFTPDSTELYTINEYLHYDSHINDAGSVLFSYQPYVTNMNDSTPVLTIYKQGNVAKTYRISELVRDSDFFNSIKNYAAWYTRTFVNNDTVFVITRADTTIAFNFNTGNILKKERNKNILDRYNGKIVLPKTIHIPDTNEFYNWDVEKMGYSHTDDIEKLKNGKSYEEELSNFLGMKVTNKYEDAMLVMHIFLLVDKTGKSDVYNIDYYNEKRTFSDSEKHKIRDWHNNLLVDGSLVPAYCDKWLFHKYIYLK
ncbi:MAG: hypothetical protein ACK4EY_01055 [Flavipsychrobacter sp.]